MGGKAFVQACGPTMICLAGLCSKKPCLAVLLLNKALQLCQGVYGVLSSEALGAAAGWQR